MDSGDGLAPLNLASTKELVDEIQKRVAGSVVILARDGEGKGVHRYYYSGGHARALGLCEMMKDGLLHGFDEEPDDLDESEEI